MAREIYLPEILGRTVVRGCLVSVSSQKLTHVLEIAQSLATECVTADQSAAFLCCPDLAHL